MRQAGQVGRSGERRRARWRWWIAGLLIFGGLVGVVSHRGEIEHFVELARHLRPELIAGALALQAGTYFCVAGVWYGSLRAAGARLPLISLVPLGIAKLFSDQAMPSAGMSGNALVVAALRRRGVKTELCMGTLLVSLVGYYGAFVALTGTSLGLLWWYHQIHAWIVIAATVFCGVAVAIPGSVLMLKRRTRAELPGWVTRLPAVAGVLQAFADAPTELLRRPAVVANAVGLQASVVMLDAATLWLLLGAIGASASYAVALPSFVLASIAAMLGLIPLGLGAFEATCVGMLRAMGVPLEPALTATLLLRGFTTWIPMLPGMWLARRALG